KWYRGGDSGQCGGQYSIATGDEHLHRGSSYGLFSRTAHPRESTDPWNHVRHGRYTRARTSAVSTPAFCWRVLEMS
ncbi:unnamed protein product, partial [Ectocarpus sp. 12 AP-2014]